MVILVVKSPDKASRTVIELDGQVTSTLYQHENYDGVSVILTVYTLQSCLRYATLRNWIQKSNGLNAF